MASNYVSSRIGSRTFQTSYKIRVLSDFTYDAAPRGSEGRSGPTPLVSYILPLASHKTTFGRSSCTTSWAMESPLTCATNLHKQWPHDYQDTMNRCQCEGRPTRRSTRGGSCSSTGSTSSNSRCAPPRRPSQWCRGARTRRSPGRCTVRALASPGLSSSSPPSAVPKFTHVHCFYRLGTNEIVMTGTLEDWSVITKLGDVSCLTQIINDTDDEV